MNSKQNPYKDPSKNPYQWSSQRSGRRTPARSPKKKIPGVIRVFRMILILMCFSFVMIIYGGIKDTISILDTYDDYYTEDTYLSYLQHEQYLDLFYMTSRDCVLDKEFSETIQACQAVGRYYEAATLYKAYVKSGDKENAARQKERMNIYLSQTGEYEYHIDKINETLGLTP